MGENAGNERHYTQVKLDWFQMRQKLSTLRRATISIIEVTNNTKPARNENNANIARMFRTENNRDKQQNMSKWHLQIKQINFR